MQDEDRDQRRHRQQALGAAGVKFPIETLPVFSISRTTSPVIRNPEENVEDVDPDETALGPGDRGVVAA